MTCNEESHISSLFGAQEGGETLSKRAAPWAALTVNVLLY